MTAQWQWKSNSDPFSKSEKAQWTPYNPLDNYLLEKAFYNQQNEVELGDFIVSIKDMLQKKKNDVFRQRPIRRNIEEEKFDDQDENIRAERFFGAEAPKTFNKAFGDLQDYLRFFQNRGPDIKEFISKFNDTETSDNLNLLNSTVQSCLIQSIQDEAKKKPAVSKLQKNYETNLLALFQKPVTDIKQFYANVLKAYTMAGFLYQNLNLYLRNEDWSQLDALLPYAYCLCKAFLRSEFTTSSISESMTVYRGAQFDEVALYQYDPKKVKNFCWNGVTSTSRNREIAEKFLYNFDPKKVPVLFVIEVPSIYENTTKWIDIKPYSALPKEDEVVLPPGSVFELIKKSQENDKNTVEIHLKLMINVAQLAHQGQIMHGTLYSEMANNTNLKFVCLEGRELSDAIAHLEGNRLVEELEFSLCKFDEKVEGIRLEKIPKIKSLIFISPVSGKQGHWSSILKHFEKAPVEKLEISEGEINDEGLDTLSQRIRSLASLTSLILNFKQCDQITDEGLNYLGSQTLKFLTSLTYLTLDFTSNSNITGEGLKNLSSQGLKSLTSLTSLTLNFGNCLQITDSWLNDWVSQGLIHLTSLRSLNLYFGDCKQITDEGLNHLSSQELKYLTSLTSLTLIFPRCQQITDTGLNHLAAQGLQHLTSLRSLNLDFEDCQKITDKGLKNLSCQGLKYLTSLTSLTLKFSRCGQIMDQGLKNLSYQGFKYLTSLTSLTLDFEACHNMCDDGLFHLSYHGFEFLTSLKSLTLNFDYCQYVSNSTMQDLKRFLNQYPSASSEDHPKLKPTTFVRKVKNTKFEESALAFDNTIMLDSSEKIQSFTENIEAGNGQKILLGVQNIVMGGTFCCMTQAFSCIKMETVHTTLLTSLTLNFSLFCGFEDEDLDILISQELKHLPSLTSLTLDFSDCPFSDQGFTNLLFESLKHLTSLTSLTLSLKNCRITDEVLSNLSSQGLKHLTSLSSLNLDFISCSEIADEALNHLTSQGFKYLTRLTSLALNFSSCDKISDERLIDLSSKGLIFLTSLTSLTLNFSSCKLITDEGLKSLSSHGLKYLTSLSSLSLDFGYCPEITEEGLKSLSLQGFKDLPSLTSLSLCFTQCGITDKGLENFTFQGLKCLTSLTSFTFDFQYNSITDKGLNNLISHGLKYLISLTFLTLNFEFCSGIYVEAWSNFCKILKYFGYEISKK